MNVRLVLVDFNYKMENVSFRYHVLEFQIVKLVLIRNVISVFKDIIIELLIKHVNNVVEDAIHALMLQIVKLVKKVIIKIIIYK